MKRQWVDPSPAMRCNALIHLKDRTEAQCGKYRSDDARGNPAIPTALCTQHLRMFCGGKDVIDFRFRVSLKKVADKGGQGEL